MIDDSDLAADGFAYVNDDASYRERMDDVRPIVSLHVYKIPVAAGDPVKFSGIVGKTVWAKEVGDLVSPDAPLGELGRVVEALSRLVDDARLIVAAAISLRIEGGKTLPILAETAAPGGGGN
jgi:hypothetical protein